MKLLDYITTEYIVNRFMFGDKATIIYWNKHYPIEVMLAGFIHLNWSNGISTARSLFDGSIDEDIVDQIVVYLETHPLEKIPEPEYEE